MSRTPPSEQAAPEPLPDVLKRLMKERGLDENTLWVRVANAGFDAPKPTTITSHLKGRRFPEREQILALAVALEVSPTVFAEYRLAEARALLDPSEVGLDVALRTLDEIEPALLAASEADAVRLLEQAEPPAARKTPRSRRSAAARRRESA